MTSQCKNRASEEILHLVLLFGSYLRVPPRSLTLIQCVASSAVRRTAILVLWPSLETAPRLSSTATATIATTAAVADACLQRNRTLPPVTGAGSTLLWCLCACPLVPRPHLETGSLASEPAQYFAGFLFRGRRLSPPGELLPLPPGHHLSAHPHLLQDEEEQAPWSSGQVGHSQSWSSSRCTSCT